MVARTANAIGSRMSSGTARKPDVRSRSRRNRMIVMTAKIGSDDVVNARQDQIGELVQLRMRGLAGRSDAIDQDAMSATRRCQAADGRGKNC